MRKNQTIPEIYEPVAYCELITMSPDNMTESFSCIKLYPSPIFAKIWHIIPCNIYTNMRFFGCLILSLLLFGLFCIRGFATSPAPSLESQLQDSVMTTKIMTLLIKNVGINPLKISVSSHHGTVTISGHVKTQADYIHVLRILKNTTGVDHIVATNLGIGVVNSSLSDAYITTKVEAAILRAKVLDDESIPLVGIRAQTNNGVVTLEGTVPHDKAKLAIITRVSKVRGIRKLISHILVATNNTIPGIPKT